MTSPHFSVTADVNATDLFTDDNINWRYCMENATFKHKSACEFLIHSGDQEHVNRVVEEMKSFNCTEDFIKAYQEAASSGATRVLFWA